MEKDIWFVDDDPTFRYIVKREMESTVYADRVDMFDDGDRALVQIVRAAKSGSLPKIIFLDLNMKNLEGWQTVDMLNEFERNVNIVILSSSLNPKDLERAESEPLVREMMSKPVNAEAIISRIEKYCD